MFKLTFGREVFKVKDLEEVDLLLKSAPGRLLQIDKVRKVRTSLGNLPWYLFYSDGEDIFCGFRKSTSETFHFFQLPIGGIGEFSLPQHFEKLKARDALKYRRKRKGVTAKGKGSKKFGVSIYLGRDHETVGRKISDRAKDLKL